MASVGRVACNSTPAVGLSAQTERQSRGTVLPVFIGFLRQFAAMLATGPGTQFEACRVLPRSDDPAHVHGMPDPMVPICSRPSQFCNRLFPVRVKRDIDPPPMRITPAKAEVMQESGEGDCRPPPAFGLGKRWRFFTTYTGVQTSPVLRQQSLERA